MPFERVRATEAIKAGEIIKLFPVTKGNPRSDDTWTALKDGDRVIMSDGVMLIRKTDPGFDLDKLDHSEDPNCTLIPVTMFGMLNTLVLGAKRDIDIGEMLSVDHLVPHARIYVYEHGSLLEYSELLARQLNS